MTKRERKYHTYWKAVKIIKKVAWNQLQELYGFKVPDSYWGYLDGKQEIKKEVTLKPIDYFKACLGTELAQ